MQLLYSNCVPKLTYGAAIRDLSATEKHRYNVAVNNAIRAIFRFRYWQSIRQLREFFHYDSIEVMFAKARKHFLLSIKKHHNGYYDSYPLQLQKPLQKQIDDCIMYELMELSHTMLTKIHVSIIFSHRCVRVCNLMSQYHLVFNHSAVTYFVSQYDRWPDSLFLKAFRALFSQSTPPSSKAAACLWVLMYFFIIS